MSRLSTRSLAVMIVLLTATACGTNPPQQAGGNGNTTDVNFQTDLGGNTDTGGVDAVGSDTSTSDTGTSTDAQTADAAADAGSDVDAGTADVPKTGCERDSDCATHPVGACEKPVCDLGAQSCKGAPLDEGSSCDDGDVCTDSDICKGGSCAGAAVVCNDGDPCTTDVCDAASKSCKSTAIAAGGACDDGDKCTEKDACGADGACKGADVNCDDGDICTADACTPSSGCLSNPASGPCDDGDACTADDACVDGTCAGQAAACDDGNPCTDDSCDKLKGCVNAANTGSCDDGDACTEKDTCGADGKCAAGTAKVCTDSSACTDDSCDPATGCVNKAKTDGAQCDDGSNCTNGDACAKGSCVGQKVDCNDKNPCTTDVCDPLAGCTNAANDKLACDDGDACTTGDSCKAGECVTTGGVTCDDKNPCTDDTCDPKTKKCGTKPNVASCDDGNSCTENDQCAKGSCGAGKAILCDDKNPCTTDTCDAKTGSCAFAANTASCEDGNKCTTGDTCAKGACAGKAVVCDDNNPCTDDACKAADGTCGAKAKADGVGCDDGSVCSAKDICTAGKCGGKTIECDDANPCTVDSCDAKKGCQSKPTAGGVGVANSTVCDDDDPCTVGDVCGEGVCQPGAKKKVCSDNKVCTDDACVTGKGCAFSANTAKCDDGDACTGPDVCAKAVCGGKAKTCDDSNPCTTDSCDKTKGCLHANNKGACDDGTVCTKADKCDGKGTCVAGAKIACADGNGCTTDSCDAKKGCVFPIVKDGKACDDGNGCTTKDVCAKGKCAGVGKSCDDDNPCTADACASDKCSHKNTTSACNDGDTCTQVDTCDGKGKCVGKSPIACDDKNGCTNDTCINGVGCSFKANTKACDDGAWCTSKDACKDGQCGGVKKGCDDANGCTVDLCSDQLKKCLNIASANGAKCDDGNKCSTNDACDGKKSCIGVAIVCDDGNPCTVDKCEAKGGACVFTMSATACKGRAVPFIEAIDYKDADWFGSSNSKGVVWATDATPLKLTGNASLNFNNGKTYGSGTKTVRGVAVSTFLIDASKVKTGALTFAFWSYNGIDVKEVPGDLAKGAQLDGRYVEFSVDGFKTVTTFALDGNKDKGAWVQEALDISSLKGKTFQVRFRFDSEDGGTNGGKGWHIDTVDVYAGPIVRLKQGGKFVEPFLPSNPNGWQFSAPLANTKSGFGIDKTPAAPGGFGGTASLNFNNGVGYDDNARVAGEAWSPVIDLRGVTGKNATLWFKTWNDVGDSGATWDQRFVDVTDLAFTKSNSEQMSNAKSWKKGWVWSFIDLTDFIGKRVRMRFRFDSKDKSFNAGTGWFIDDLVLDTRPVPPYATLIHCSATNLFTVGNTNTTGARWAVDATGIAPKSPDCSLNFNDGKSFICPTTPTKATKMQGTATSASFSVPVPATAGAKTSLTFSTYQDVEGSAKFDRMTVVATGTKKGAAAVVKTWTVAKKIANLKKWQSHTYDISALHGYEVTLRFGFDSKDCFGNAGAGVAVDDIMVRANK